MFNPSIRSGFPIIARTFQTARSFAPLAMYSTPRRINDYVTTLMQERKFLWLINAEEKAYFRPPLEECLPQKNLILQLLRPSPKELTQKQVSEKLKEIGFDIRKAEFLNVVESLLTYGGSGSIPLSDSDDLVRLLQDIKNAGTIEELQSVYTAVKGSPCFEYFGTGKMVLDFLILEQAQQNSFSFLRRKCIFYPEFPSDNVDQSSRNKECFEQTKSFMLNLCSVLAKNPSYFTPKSEIDFPALQKTIEASQNQVDVRRALYSESLCERLPLKSLVFIGKQIQNREELYFDSNRVEEHLWHILVDPEKAGVTLRVDEEFLQQYLEAKQFQIACGLRHDDDRRSNSRRYHLQYGTTNPSIQILREEAIEEIKEALLTGQYASYREDMRWLIDAAKERN